MRYLAPLPLLALTGCAASSAGLYREPVEFSVASNRSAQDFATCVAEVVQGPAELRGSGGHWWVVRATGAGTPVVRWDFTDKPAGGSIAELRATAIMGAAKDKVERCAAI